MGDKEDPKTGSGNTNDFSSPYYLHPSDFPKQLHVNEVLTDGNYTDWAREMSNFLFAKNKIDFVDGTLKKPETTSLDYKPWMRCDAMVKGWLTAAMEKGIRDSVKYATTASEIWTDLRERFGKESAPRAYELKQKIAGTRQDGSSVSIYYTRLRALWDESQSIFSFPCCSCNKCTCELGKKITEHIEKERLYEFLMGLDTDFNVIKTQILATTPLPTLGIAYHMVAEDERHRMISNVNQVTTEPAAFKAFQKRENGSGDSKEKTAGKESKQSDQCTFCGRNGHKKEGCFKLVGYPDWWPGKKDNKVKPKAACVEMGTSPIPGLSEEQYQEFVKFFSGSGKNAEIKPEANMAGNRENFFIGLRSRDLIGSGRCQGGLYLLNMSEEGRKAMVTTTNVWHKRLGHTSKEKLSNIDFLKNNSNKLCDVFCDSCAKAKHTRTPFPSSFIKTNDCFELIHCDIWGGYRIPSYTRASYFLTIVDDYSRAVWIFLIKHKSDASQCLINFHKFVEVQFKKQIKRVRSDNGGEFTSNSMMSFYEKNGILLETTCPHTPQQNGVVERKHRHLLETARALRFEANIPKRFWGECILTAAYIINRLPSKVIKNKTPYELVWKQKPVYYHLRVFGCLAYFRNTNTNGDKLEERGKPGIFLGYPQGIKGYKVYDIETKKIIVSRDVFFLENTFPFKNTTTTENLNWDEPNKNCGGPQFDSSNHIEYPHIEVEQVVESEENSRAQQENEESFDLSDEMNLGLENQNETTDNLNESEPREKRTRSRPARLNDYVVDIPPSLNGSQPDSSQAHSTVHPLSQFVTYDKFSPSHKAFLTAIDSIDEPSCFAQASKDQRWREAMEQEIQALERNKTWTLEELPKGKRAIDSKWIYKTKYKSNGEVERYKARLVAKGFTQMEGVDYHETFAPVAKLVTVRTLLAVATKNDWIIHQLDVNNAFLHGDLDEEVYMKIPQGFSREGDTRVCRLRKSLYGLKQASRNWYHKFTSFLSTLGFKQSKADYSLFTFQKDDVYVATLIYVDDVIIVGNNTEKIQQTKIRLDDEFSIKDLGQLKYFLGIEVAKTSEGLVLSQRKYILDILKDSGMLGCRPSAFPFEQGTKLDKGEKEAHVDASQYRRLVGRLLYLQATRPDITYSVNILSQFVADPRQSHLDAANRVLRYLKGTPGQGVLLPRAGPLTLTAYCDSDWLGCPFTRRSRTGYLLLFGGGPISWKTKKQSVVSRSSAEAEYRAMASTVSEILWVRWLLKDLQVDITGPTNLFCDNQAARNIATNPVYHERTKHVEMDCFFVRERVETREISPQAIESKLQLADLLTKGLGTQQLRSLLSKMGIKDLHAPP
ncbi:putative RNA-directed DNA polymerase [Helianthus annuus]|nr:putative RNA-directed DNA polymerase [Helianthus annuus]KAJ0563010.1 putative RNA-directed DNA polymerase [Helianthus annuus]KAJ0728383.1 putative RNA-directed DNA polymerase [Helianthus annuus]